MALSRIAQEFADEVAQHDWSDAPYRMDRAGHSRAGDSNRGAQVLTPAETESVRTNVMWVIAQVLGYHDPNFDEYEFAEACGVDTHAPSGRRSGHIRYGLRRDHDDRFLRPGTWESDPQ